VTPPEAELGDDRFGSVAAHFGYALQGRPTEAVLAAFDALLRSHLPPSRAGALAASLEALGRHDAAFELYQRLDRIGDAWRSLSAAKGEDAAARWVRSLSPEPDAAPRFFAQGAYELLWAAFPARSPADSLWMWRAAAVARDADAARRHGADVLAWFDRVPKSKEQYLGRILLGLERDPPFLRGKLSRTDLCQVSWALGLAAQAREELPLAVDCYEVAASTGDGSSDCVGNARRQLDEWRRHDQPFDKSWTPRLHELFASN
jgi:hypothetical protein